MIFINEMFPSLCPSIYIDKKFQSVYIEGIIVRKKYMIKKKKIKNDVLLLQNVLLTK
jgi:hypothetical protein